jgi:alcohol dehydrogenase class IV
MDDIGMSRNFNSLGIQSASDIATIVDNGFNPQRVNNNPRRVTAGALTKMLFELKDGAE